MAQAGYTPISLYYSTTAAAVPTSGNLANGELGINIQDEKLYFKNAAGIVKLLASNATSAPVLTFSAGTTGFTPSTATSGAITLAGTLVVGNGGTGLTTLTAGYIPFGAGTSAFGSSANLFWDNTNGRLGVGTSSPAGLLDVSGTAPVLTASQSSITVTSGTLIGAFNAYSRDSSTTSTGGVGGIRVYASAEYNTSNTPSYMSFFTHDTSPNDGTLLGNPTEQMRLDSSGNLGLGVTPSAWGSDTKAIQMAGSTFSAISGAARTLILANAYHDGTNFRYTSAGTAFQYRLSTGTSAHEWYTAPSGSLGAAITFTQAMTLDANGKLGIGTTSPQEKLQLEGSGSQYMRVKTTTTNADIYFGITSSSVGYVGTGGSDPLSFLTGGTERARIDSSGNVGIGTTSPNFDLHISTGSTSSITQPTAGSYGLYIQQNTSGSVGGLYIQDGASNSGASIFVADNNNAARFVVGTDGAVGIGTSLPNAKATIWTSSTTGLQTALRLNNPFGFDNLNTGAQIVFSQDRTTAEDLPQGIIAVGQGLAGTSAESFMAFYTNNTGVTEKMRISAAGLVGIGTNAPGQRLDVNGSIRSRDGAFIASIGTTTKGLFCTYNQIFGSGSDYTPVIFAETGLGITFAVNGTATKAMSLDTSGNLLVNTTSQLGVGKVNIAYAGASEWGMAFKPTGQDSSTAIVFRNSSDTSVGSIQTTTSATSYVTSSDYRLKNTIAPMTGALAKVALLKPCTYKWNVDGSDGQGFIAHELAEVCPDAVVGEKDAVDAEGNPKYQGIDTSFLVATLTAAIQEQQAIIESLKARLDAANL